MPFDTRHGTWHDRRAGLVEPIHADGHEHRATRFGHCNVVSSGDGLGDVYRAMRLNAPFHVRPDELSLSPPKKWLGPDLPPVLLPGGKNDGRLGVPGGDDGVHSVARAGGRVQIDHRSLIGQQRMSSCHSYDRCLLQAQDVAKILRVVLQKGKFCRTWIAEDRVEPAGTQDF